MEPSGQKEKGKAKKHLMQGSRTRGDKNRYKWKEVEASVSPKPSTVERSLCFTME